MGGRQAAQGAICVRLLGVGRRRLRTCGVEALCPRGVVVGDRLADVVGDRRRGVWPGPEGAQADDLLGADDRLQRPPAAWAQVAGVRGGVAFAPDARPACRTLEVRHASVSAGGAQAGVGGAGGALELA